MTRRASRAAGLIAGKVRRFMLVQFRPGYVARQTALREGECNRCGRCCKILFRCPFLIEEGTEFRCRIYGRHFTACKLFPLDAADLAELDGEWTSTFVKPENVLWAGPSPR